MQRVVISQPMYFPWAGFLSQLAMADTLIWLDDVQFSKGSFTNRVQVKTQQGVKWMSVPLARIANQRAISRLQTSDPDTYARHRSLLQTIFIDAVYSNEALQLYDVAWSHGILVEILIASSTVLAEAVGITLPRMFRSSEMSAGGAGSKRVLELVKSVGGDTYISGHGGRNYLCHEDFDQAGIEVKYMNYCVQPWRQANEPFAANVSGLDLVANVPPSDRMAHLASDTQTWRRFCERRE
jgi:hypothetical protein